MKHSKAHERTRESKRVRRERREGRSGDTGRRGRGRPPGAWADPVLPGLRDLDPGASWSDLRTRILPLLRRSRRPSAPGLEPIELIVPPGVTTGFGLDLGLAWAHVTRTLVDRWAISDADLLATALDNLRARVADEPPQIERATFGGTPATVLQAVGWGSALLLLPDTLGGLLGGSPRTLLTPVRNTLIAMPEDLDVELAVAVWAAFAEEGGEELDVDPLYWTGTTVAAHPRAIEPVH